MGCDIFKKFLYRSVIYKPLASIIVTIVDMCSYLNVYAQSDAIFKIIFDAERKKSKYKMRSTILIVIKQMHGKKKT